MKIGKLIEKGLLKVSDVNDIGVPAIEILEHKLFEDNHDKDYREEAIEVCIANKINFHNTVNNSHEFCNKLVALRCPVCNEFMKTTGYSGGNSNSHTHSYSCEKCKVTGCITVQHNAVDFIFGREED